MAKKKVKEANELAEIWNGYLDNLVGGYIILYRQENWERILPFWHLKAKIEKDSLIILRQQQQIVKLTIDIQKLESN